MFGEAWKFGTKTVAWSSNTEKKKLSFFVILEKLYLLNFTGLDRIIHVVS